MRASARELLVALLPLTVALGLVIWAVLHFVRPAAPKVLTISTGPDGSTFQRVAERYGKAFERNGFFILVENQFTVGELKLNGDKGQG